MKNIDPQKLTTALATELKKFQNIKAPSWSFYTKTGVNAERPPQQPDFWYFRSAAVLRRIYSGGPLGVSRLRTIFGGKRRRGHKPAHARKAGGKVIRLILQQLEKENLVVKVEKPRKGRTVTPKGQRLIAKAAKVVK